MKEKFLAVVTARGGSKRIPRKNIKKFCGKAIIEYSIDAALKSGIFDEVMVSTEDDEIAKISIQAGASVPFMRSEQTANDFATTRDVLLEVLSEYKKRGQEFDYITCLYPTNPFISPGKIKKAVDILVEEQCEEVVPVVKFSFPPQRAYVLNEEGGLTYKWDEYKNARSQDLEEFYHDAGQFYCYNVKQYLESKGQITGKIYPIVLPESEVQDIDNEEDWKMAELKYEYLKRNRK